MVVDLHFEANHLQKDISDYGIASKEITIFYGNKVLSTSSIDNFILIPTYQVPIGELEEAFLYVDKVFISIESTEAFQKFIQGYNNVGISFFYDTCMYSLILPTIILSQNADYIDIIINKDLFSDPAQFLLCQSQTYFKGTQLKLNINFANSIGVARYELLIETTRSCFHNTQFIILNNDLQIQTKVLPLCETSVGKYTLQIQSYKSLFDQITDEKSILLEMPIILTGKTDLIIPVKQNNTLQQLIINAYSVFFVLVDEESEIDDQEMTVKISKVNDYNFYIIITLVLQLICTIIFSCIVLFIKCKPIIIRKNVKTAAIDDLQ